VINNNAHAGVPGGTDGAIVNKGGVLYVPPVAPQRYTVKSGGLGFSKPVVLPPGPPSSALAVLELGGALPSSVTYKPNHS
jgi:hypothetical protein